MSDALTTSHTRRVFISGTGALVISLSTPASSRDPAPSTDGAMKRPPFTPSQLDSWLSIDEAGDVTCFFGKIDVAQGLDVAVRLIVAEELDVGFERIRVLMGNSATTINHGGATSDSGVREGGALMRITAAEARMLLLEMASRKLNSPVSSLSVSNGVVTFAADPSRTISYAELIGGRYFNAQLHWNKKFGRDLEVSGTAKPKPPSEYKIVGTPTSRTDISPKVMGEFEYVSDVRLPGMLHGRMVRPSIAGAVPVNVDESSLKAIAGARVVWIKNFLGVVAEKEWDAVRAADALKVTWSDSNPAFPPQEELHAHIRTSKVVKREYTSNVGSVEAAIKEARAQKFCVVEAEYAWPFQSHASLGPACAVADVNKDHVTIYTASQKPYDARIGIAELLGREMRDVTTIWIAGSGSYGRNDAGDCSADAAVLSNAVGKPVRVQYSRAEATAWDPKGSASIQRVQAAFDESGKVVAYDFMTKGFSLRDMPPWERKAANTLAGHLLGFKLEPIQAFGIPNDSYRFQHQRIGWETIPPLMDRASPLRTAHLRATASPMCHFASEQFTDELALVAQSDPVRFRLQYLTDPRDHELLKQTAEKFGWDDRIGPNPGQGGRELLRGRGVAVAQKEGTCVAVFVEVEVSKSTGRVRPVRYTVGHDCGLIINPRGLQQVLECQTIWATSRALCEEVTFDANMVTSKDWTTYPTIDMNLVPEKIDFVLINRPELPAAGAGEHAARVVAAALANAVFDATAVRIRSAPLSQERVKKALGRA